MTLPAHMLEPFEEVFPPLGGDIGAVDPGAAYFASPPAGIRFAPKAKAAPPRLPSQWPELARRYHEYHPRISPLLPIDVARRTLAILFRAERRLGHDGRTATHALN